MKISVAAAGWIMILITGAETAFGTYFTANNAEFIKYFSIAYFVSGLFIAVFPLIRFRPLPIPIDSNSRAIIAKQILIAVTFAGLITYVVFHISSIFYEYPIDYRSSDVIPQIIVSCNRWLHGTWIYQPIPEIWNGLLPSYLPMMWIPYAPLQLLGVDVRWTTVIFYSASIALLAWMLAQYARVNWLQLILILVFICNLIFIQIDYNRIFFAWSEEGVVVAYYILLGFALSRKNPWLIAIGITCCVLSRYSLFFWIPAFFLFQFFSGEKKKALLEALIVFILVMIIFIIPFFIKDPLYFLQLPEKYTALSERTWTNEPDIIFKGLGLAKFFSISQVRLLHNLQLSLAIIVPAVFYITLYWLRKKPIINLSFAGLSGLKLTLVFFYNFLEVPYYTLFIVNTLFSYVILLHFLNPASQQPTVVSTPEIPRLP